MTRYNTSQESAIQLRRRQTIKDCARRLILDRGVAGTSMKDLAAESGVSRRTLYRYFADIEQVAKAVLVDITDSPDFFGVNRIVRGSNGLDSFRLTCLAFAQYCQEHIDILKYYYEYDYHFREPSDETIHSLWRNRPHVFRLLIQEGIADGSIRVAAEQAQAIAWVIENSILALNQRLLLREKILELECGFTRTELGALCDLLLAGLETIAATK